MKPWTVRQLLQLLAIVIAVWAFVATGCLMVGSTSVGWPTASQFSIRLEPVLSASLIGAALGCAGAVYQAILRNPLADPYLLGISSGASLGSYLWHFVTSFTLVAALSQQGAALVGALIAVMIVFSLSARRGRLDPVTLILVGVILSTVCASIFLLINSLHPELAGGSGGPLSFLVGGIRSNLSAWQRGSAAVFVFVGFIALLLISGDLNIATLSESEALALGVRIHRLRWIALIIASIVTAAAVAISGPIAFVGLICPHLARGIVGSDQRRLLPAATAAGAILLAGADAGARLLSQQSLANTVLPVGVLTSMLGGPFFLFLLWQTRRRTEI